MSYHFNLIMQAFSVVFHKAIERAEKSDDVKQRIQNLIDSITYSVFVYTTRGLFERDKLTFTSQVTFQVRLSGELSMRNYFNGLFSFRCF